MPGIDQTYNRIVAYLKDLLSDRQRHELEKDMMRDVFENDAYDGLSQLSAGDFGDDMQILSDRLNKKLNQPKKREMKVFLRIAAGLIFLVGVGSILYFVFRTPSTNLLSDENGLKKTIHHDVPSVTKKTVQAQPIIGNLEKDNKRDISKPENQPVLAQNNTEDAMEMREESRALPEPTSTEKKYIEAESSDQIAPQTVTKSASGRKPAGRTLTGTVVDSEGEALPGVNIVEKGTSRGTVTDDKGRFTLEVSDTSTLLNLTYIGFKSLELSAGKIAENEISMQEDLVSLNEIVVVGYGTQRKSETTGAVSKLEARDFSTNPEITPYNFMKPIPPGGSMKVYKQWVEEKLDFSKFPEYHGKKRIQITLSIKSDGVIHDIRIQDSVPAAIANEFQRIISQGPPWKPALKDNIPVESQVIIRFVITLD